MEAVSGKSVICFMSVVWKRTRLLSFRGVLPIGDSGNAGAVKELFPRAVADKNDALAHVFAQFQFLR